MKKKLNACLITMGLSCLALIGIELEGNLNLNASSDVSYVDLNGETKTISSFNEITNNTTALTEGWWTVSGEVTITSCLEITENVNLILCDGCNFSITPVPTADGSNAGKPSVYLNNGGTITIYGQEGGTGELNIKGTEHPTDKCYGGSAVSIVDGSFVVNGGVIRTTGGAGSDNGGNGFDIESMFLGEDFALAKLEVNRGKVYAYGGDFIGDSKYQGVSGIELFGSNAKFILTGGEVYSYGTQDVIDCAGAGLSVNDGTYVNISGGKLTLSCSPNALYWRNAIDSDCNNVIVDENTPYFGYETMFIIGNKMKISSGDSLDELTKFKITSNFNTDQNIKKPYAIIEELPYKVIYHANDKTDGTIPDTQYGDKDDEITLEKNDGGLKKNDKVLVGWNTKEDLTGTTYKLSSKYIFDNSSIDLYAVWGNAIKEIKFEEFATQCYENPTTTPSKYWPIGKINLSNDNCEVVGFGAFKNGSKYIEIIVIRAKEGNVFYKKNDVTLLDKNGNTLTINGNNVIVERESETSGFSDYYSGDLQVGDYVCYFEVTLGTKNFEVKYDKNSDDCEGNVPVDNGEYAGDGIATVCSNSGNLVRDGYYFDGWNTKPDGTGTTYTPGSSLSISYFDQTLYAIWTKKIAVNEPTLNTSEFVYDGSEKTVSINGVESYMTADDANILSATNVGEYQVKYTLDGQHEWEEGQDGVITWMINKAQATITVDQTDIIKSYGEEITLPTATSNFGTVVCDKTSSDLINVGIYYVTYSVASTDNYNGDSKQVKVVIKAQEIKSSELIDEKPSVVVETNNGFDPTIDVKVEVTVEVEVETANLLVDYYNLQAEGKQIKLNDNEVVGVVFNVKLIQTIDGVAKEIQPSDIAPGTVIKVKMLIPDSVDTSKITRILHVHSETDIESFTFDPSKLDENGYYEMQIDRLSEFAFIYAEDVDVALWVIIGLTVLFMLIMIATFMFISKEKPNYEVKENDSKFMAWFRSLSLQALIQVIVSATWVILLIVQYIIANCALCYIFTIVETIIVLVMIGYIFLPTVRNVSDKYSKWSEEKFANKKYENIEIAKDASFMDKVKGFFKKVGQWFEKVFDKAIAGTAKGLSNAVVVAEGAKEQATLSDSIKLAGKDIPTFDANKNVIYDYLNNKYSDVKLNKRENYVKKSKLPLADTHYVVVGKLMVCFVYVYNLDNNGVLLLVKNKKAYKELSKKHKNVNVSAFPAGGAWISVPIDSTYTLKEVQDILDDAHDVQLKSLEKAASKLTLKKVVAK